MLKWKQIVGLMAFAGLLLFGFQNCGMQFEEDLASSEDFDASGLNFNPDGTFSFPLPGENSGNGGSSGSGSGGDIDLGSGGGGGSGGGLGGSGGGYFEDDPYNPYQDNHSKSSLYPATPSDGGVMGKKLYYFTNNGRLDMDDHMDGGILWKSYTMSIDQWVAQQPGTQERERLLVMSFKKLSQEATSSTYMLDGTSICYRFTAKVTLPNVKTAYTWQEVSGGQASNVNTYSIQGYRAAISGVTIIKKTEEEMTMLESAGCGAMAAYDHQGISSFFNLLKSYPILTPSNSSFQLSRTGRWSRYINSALAPF